MGNVLCPGDGGELQVLARDGDHQQLQARLQDVPRDKLDVEGQLALQKAVKHMRPLCVDVLLRAGIQATQRDQEGHNVFHILVAELVKHRERLNDALSVQKVLVKHLGPAGVRATDVPDREGTPLALALSHKQEALAKGFLEAGFSPTGAINSDRSNALQLAIMSGNAGLVTEVIKAAEQRFLLRDVVNQPTVQGVTALHRTVSMKMPDTADQLLALPHTNVNAQDSQGNTPLHNAYLLLLATPSNPIVSAMAAKLLSKGAAIDLANRSGQTCLSLAVDMAANALEPSAAANAQSLIEPLAAIAQGQGKQTLSTLSTVFNELGLKGLGAVHVATMLGDTTMLAGLIARGAEVDLRNAKGQPASVLAALAGRKNVLLALFGPLGADPLALDTQGYSAVAHLLISSTRLRPEDIKEIFITLVNSPKLGSNGLERLATQPATTVGTTSLPGPLPLLHFACATGNLEAVKVLVQDARIPADLPSNTQMTPLATTVAAVCAAPTSAGKFIPIAEFLVHKGASPEGKPLGKAIDEGQLDIVMAMLRRAKQHVDFKSPSGATALYLAIVQGNVAAVRELVSQLGAHAGPQPLFTPLHVAVGCQQPAVVQFLLGNAEARSGINQLDCHKRTPLAYCWTAWRTDALAAGHMLPAAKARSMDVNATQVQLAQLLLEQPDCDPNMPVDASGRRMLHLAVDQGRFALIKMMAVTARGLDPNLPDADGMSPLHRAVQRGEPNVVQAVASLPGWDQAAMSQALMAAVQAGNNELVAILMKHPTVKVDMGVFKACMQLLDTKPSVCESILAVLLDPTHASKCSIDLSNARAFTLTAKIGNERVELPPLHHVACLDKARMVDLLVKQGKAVVSATDSRGLTALHHAVACKAMTAANALVNNGADISALGNAPTTPLIAAVQDLDVGMVALLLSSTKPFNINAMDGQGHTALTIVASKLLEPTPMERPGPPGTPLGHMPSQPHSSYGPQSRTSFAVNHQSVRLELPERSQAHPSLDTISYASNSTNAAPEPVRANSGPTANQAAEDALRLLLRKGADVNQPLPANALRSEISRTMTTQISTMVSSSNVLPPTPRRPTLGSMPSALHTPPSLSTAPSGLSLASSRMGSVPSGALNLEAELFTPLLLAIQLRAEHVLNIILTEASDYVDMNGERSWPAIQVAIQCVQLLSTQRANGEERSSNVRDSRSSFPALFTRMINRGGALTACNPEEVMDAAMRILARLLQEARLDLNVPFEGLVLQQMAEWGGPYALKIMRLLLTAPGTRANINGQHLKTGSTALHTAAAKHDKEMIEMLANAKGVDFNILDNNGHTPLAVAVQAGARDVITSLLQLGLSNDLAADILDPTKCSQDPATSPIALAMAQSEHRVLQTLVTGLSMANNMVAQTAVSMPQHHHKTSSGNVKTLAPAPYSPSASRQYDIEAVLNQPIDSAGRTPVLVACKALHLDHAQVLVKTERQTWPVAALDVAEPEPLNRSNSAGLVNGNVDAEHALATPLHMVLEYIITLKSKPRSTKGLQEQLTRACVLASDMASAPSMATAVGMKDAVGFTPLHWAVMAKLDDVVQILCPKARKLGCIDASADTDKGQGITPLHLAVQLNLVTCAHYLLLHAADPNVTMSDRRTTPLLMCKAEQSEMKLLLMNPPAITVEPTTDPNANGKNIVKRGTFASGYDTFSGQLAYTWKQVKNAGDSASNGGGMQKRASSVSVNGKGKVQLNDAEAAARGKQTSKTLYQIFRNSLEVTKVAANALGPVGAALVIVCTVADELLEGVDKLVFSNMIVSHVCGRIRRQVPTLQSLRKALEASKNEECAQQLLPHVKNLGEVYLKIHSMVEEWSSTARASTLARIFASKEFWDDLLLQEKILTGCMTDLGAIVNAFKFVGVKINAEEEDPEKLKAEMRNLIRQDMQTAMQQILEVEAMGGDVREAQASAVKMFKEYGLDYNKLKKKEQRKWKGDKLKELIIAPSELQILGKVGTGGSAQVFRAMYQGHPVAYKQFEALPNQGDVLREGVENEAYIMSQLRHPNIIQLYGMVADKDKHQYGLVVDYHAPGSLQNMIDSRMQSVPVSVQERVALVLQIACGMAYLHTRSVEPIVHGDLKPSNVLVSEDGRAVITDFGLSRVTSNSTTTTTQAHKQSDTFTSDASAVYTAPEVTNLLLNYKRKPASTDVFSFGVLCLELLTLQPCYTGFAASPEEYSLKVSQGQRPPIPDEIPALLRECIDACWHHDPEKRPSFVSIVEVLDQVYASIS